MKRPETSMRKHRQAAISKRDRFPKCLEGKHCEFKLLGKCLQEHTHGISIPKHTAMEIVRKNQPLHLPEFARELIDAVDYLLHPEETEGTDNIRFFTAVESSLDKKYGIDGFFEITRPERKHLITIDITMNERSINNNVDLMIYIPRDGINIKHNAKLFRETIEKAAEKIINKLQEKEIKRTITRTFHTPPTQKRYPKITKVQLRPFGV